MNILSALAIATTFISIELDVPVIPETTRVAWPELELPTYSPPALPFICRIVAPQPAPPPPSVQATLVEARHFYIHIESKLGQFERKSYYRLSLPPAAPNMGLQRDAWTSELSWLRQAISELKRP